MCKWNCPEFEPYFWQPGDFSVHCYMCGKAPIPPDMKLQMLEAFKQAHPELV